MEESIYTAYLNGSLLLSKNGEWRHNGKPFENQRLIDFFHRGVTWDEPNNRYVVRVGKQQATFDLEDTAFFAQHLDDAKLPWTLTLLDGSTEPLEGGTIRTGAEGQFYCVLKNGHRARLLRAAHQRLLDHAVSEREIEVEGEIFVVESE